jgi:SAM-dependent methyltransferase
VNAHTVQSFYERMPYPAPLTSLDVSSLKSPERRRIRSLLMFPGGAPEAPQHILVAGCGTSQAAKVALREPDARITAIDISSASLGHLRGLQQKYNLENLELRRLSLLNAAALGETFDQIICTGVLHHLPDPDAGLRSLRAVLKPGGALHVMVYARYGRAGIYMMQDYCRLLRIAPGDEELANLGEALACLPPDHPLSGMLHKVKDFAQPDALADALLHPQDRAYTVPEIHAWLARCGMTFGRWLEQAPYLPQCGAVAQTPHAARLAALAEDDQHAAVELFRGTITQHNFIAYRDDHAQAAQPVRFTGEEWRAHVPVRLPWARRITERVPPGSAAVLLNPMHRHTDIYLPIDAQEDQLLARIDGARTLGEIAQIERMTVQKARAFFEKLWRHDQIVIDASNIR